MRLEKKNMFKRCASCEHGNYKNRTVCFNGYEVKLTIDKAYVVYSKRHSKVPWNPVKSLDDSFRDERKKKKKKAAATKAQKKNMLSNEVRRKKKTS